MGKPFDAVRDAQNTLYYGGILLFATVFTLLALNAITTALNETKFVFYFAMLPIVIGIIYARSKSRNQALSLNAPETSPLLPKYLRNTPILFFSFVGALLLLLGIGLQNPQSVLGYTGQTSLPNYLQSTISSLTGTIFFDIEPAASVETLSMFLLSAFFMHFVFKFQKTNIFSVRKSLPKFVLYGIIFMVFWGVMWGAFHTARYGGDDEKYLSSVRFGAISGFIIWITQSVWFGIIYHQYNNGFLSLLANIGSNDIYSVYIVGLGLVFIGIGYYINKNKKASNTITEAFPQ